MRWVVGVFALVVVAALAVRIVGRGESAEPPTGTPEPRTPQATPPVSPTLEGHPAAPTATPPAASRPARSGVVFDVRGLRGEPVDGAEIRIRAEEEPPESASRHRWERRRPHVALAPGRYRARAVGGDQRGHVSNEASFEVPSDAPVVLSLEEGTGIAAAVKLPPEIAGADADVFLLKADDAVSDRDVAARGKRGRLHKGVATFEDLEPGRYVVAASLDRMTVAARTTVDVHGGMTRVELVVPAPDPSQFVVVRVLGPDGVPVEERDVRLATDYSSARVSAGGGGLVSRRPDGDWVVGHNPAGTLHGEPGGAWGLEVTSHRYGTLQRRYDPSTDSRLEFRFAEPVRVEIQLDGYVGSTLQGRLMVVPRPLPEFDRHGYRGVPGVHPPDGVVPESGLVVVDPIQPGPYALLLVLRGGAPGEDALVARLPFEARPGRTSVRLPIPSRQELVVRPAAPDPSLRFGLERLEDEGNWIVGYRKSDEHGVLRFPELPDGSYRLFGRYGGTERKIPVTLPGPTVVHLD
jgi:hypothetical protein